jgi:hypothetical protein
MFREDDLAQAEVHVALGAKRIAEQWRLISELQAAGRCTIAARVFLRDLEAAQALRLADRNRLRVPISQDEQRLSASTRNGCSTP